MTNYSLLHLLRLAWRQLLQDIRAGELRVLFFALLIAVTASTTIGYFSARLQASMQSRAGEFLAADLVLAGTSLPTQAQTDYGISLNLKHARTVQFTTVILGEEEVQLTTVKAAESAYPLKGKLKAKTHVDAPETQMNQGPNKGEVWVEQRLLIALNLQIGNTINVGNAPLKITKILTYEPDRSTDFYSLTPHILINMKDLNDTGSIQPGSRISYRDLWTGPADVITAYQQYLKTTLKPNQRLLTVDNSNNPQLNNTLTTAKNYLNLASLVAILLSSVAIALSANQFAIKRYDSSALLRCLGLFKKHVLILYLAQLGYIGLLACLLGALLGWLMQLGLFILLAGLINTNLPSAGYMPAVAGIMTGLITLVGFAIPPLAALGNTPPIRVLRQDIFPTPTRSWFVYGLAMLALGLIMWRLSLDVRLTLTLLLGGLISLGILGCLLFFSLRCLRRLLGHAPLAWRLGLGQLLHNPMAAIGQILAFSIILMAMSLIILLRHELLDTWKNQLPNNAPNYFAMNITPEQVNAFSQQLKTISPHISPYYPIIAGRLTKVKNKPVQNLQFKGARGKNATQRDLNLTWTAQLPNGNRITKGQWWLNSSHTPNKIYISIEEELADSLGVTVGDSLTFIISGVEYEVEIASLRTINWNNFQPNFFVIFDPNSLNNIPATYLTSFYLPEPHDQTIVKLSRQFPTVTLLDIDGLLKQLNSILGQVSLAIEYILLFVLLAGITVLTAGLQTTLADRIHQGALLRSLGASRSLLLQMRRTEFTLLGFIAGALAAISCELITLMLYQYILNLSWRPHPWLLLLPIVGAILISCIGLFGTRSTSNTSPMSILKEG